MSNVIDLIGGVSGCSLLSEVHKHRLKGETVLDKPN